MTRVIRFALLLETVLSNFKLASVLNVRQSTKRRFLLVHREGYRSAADGIDRTRTRASGVHRTVGSKFNQKLIQGCLSCFH